MSNCRTCGDELVSWSTDGEMNTINTLVANEHSKYTPANVWIGLNCRASGLGSGVNRVMPDKYGWTNSANFKNNENLTTTKADLYELTGTASNWASGVPSGGTNARDVVYFNTSKKLEDVDDENNTSVTKYMCKRLNAVAPTIS